MRPGNDEALSCQLCLSVIFLYMLSATATAFQIMNEWIPFIQPLGLMKMRLMHHQEHHLGHQAPQYNP